MRRPWSLALPSTCAVAVVVAALGAVVPEASGAAPSPTVQRVLGGFGRGDGGPLRQALVRSTLVAAAPDGSLVLYDDGRIRTVNADSSTITSVAGGGTTRAAVGVAAAEVDLTSSSVTAVAMSAQGEISWADRHGSVYSVAGGRVVRDAAALPFTQLAYEPDGTLVVIADYGTLFAYAGGSRPIRLAGGPSATSTDDGVLATDASLTGLSSVAVDEKTGDIYTGDASRIRRISAADHTISTVAGTLASSGLFSQPVDGAPASSPIVPRYLSYAPSGDIEFINGRDTLSLQLTGVTPGGTLHRLLDVTSTCSFTPFVSRAADLVIGCDGLRSLARSGSSVSYPGTLLAANSGRSGDDVPATRAWADKYDSVARLADGTLAVAQGGDLLLVHGTAVTTHHEDGEHVDKVAAAAGGGVALIESGSQNLVRGISADGATATTLAGGGSGDPAAGSAPATSVALPGLTSLATAPDGSVFVAGGGHVYGVAPAGELTHVAGFPDQESTIVGPLASDPRDGSLLVSAPDGFYRRDASGHFRRFARGIPADFFTMASDGSLVFPVFSDAPLAGLERIWPDGSSARIAGLNPVANRPSRDGLDPLGTALAPSGLALDADGGVLVVDNYRSLEQMGGLAEIRKLDLGPVARPAAPTGGSVHGDNAVLTVDVPAGVQIAIRADGGLPLDAYDSDVPGSGTVGPDGSTHLVLRRLLERPLVVGRTYLVRLSQRDSARDLSSAGEILSTVLQADRTPPAAPAQLYAWSSPRAYYAHVTLRMPPDPDVDRVEVRYQPGGTPPEGPSDGNAAGMFFPDTSNPLRGGDVPITPDQPYAFSVFAYDIQGNVSKSTWLMTSPEAPMAPTGVSASPSAASATVTWQLPYDGGSAVTAYTVTARPGGRTCTTTGTTTCTVADLIGGDAYEFTVTATNRQGVSSPSLPSSAVTPPDTTPPAARLRSGPVGASPSTSASFGFTGADPGRPSATLRFRCRLDSADLRSCTSPTGFTGLANGAHTFQVVARDEAGNTSGTVSRTWWVDTTAPRVTVGATSVFSLAGTVGLHYTGADPAGSGVATYDVRYRRAAYSGGFGALVYPATGSTRWQGTSSRSVTLTGARGYTYCFSARARDRAGNRSAWSAERCSGVPLDDRALAASGAWTRGTGSAYYAGTVTVTRSSGASLIRTAIKARRLALLATRCPGGGTVEVLWNGALLRTIHLSSTTTTNRQLMSVVDFGRVRSGTLTLRTVNRGWTRFDGLAVGGA